MSNYWVSDGSRRVLGPVSLQVIRDLLSRGRLQNLELASVDGLTWAPLATVPELAQLLAPAPQPTSSAAEEARVAAQIEQLTGRRPSEVLDLPPGTMLPEARQAFFTKVKPYHPSQLPLGASEKLRQGYAKLNELYSSALAQFQPEHVPATSPGFAAAPFGGWRKDADQTIRIELDVTPDRAKIFTDIQAASITNGGFFLPCEKPLPLFQPVEVKLRFQTPTREVAGAGRIVCEVNQTKQRGVGVRFLSLTADDKRFIEYFVRRAQIDKR